jgi:hypothetical protein
MFISGVISGFIAFLSSPLGLLVLVSQNVSVDALQRVITSTGLDA